ncbi:hypothetical protein [Bacteroides stercoris]|uniref:hypothetical protein n=1 Tax=Bacteroides stercoris TaxID=46506 RepID=UPI0034A4BED9
MEEKIEKGQQIGQLPKRDVLTGNEQFPFQEDRENGSITPNALKRFISSGKGGYMSYITEYNVSIHHPSFGIDGSNRYTLEDAIVQVPEDIRMVGLKVSFLNNSGLVETWEFAGGVFENIENWKSNEDKLTDIRDEAIDKIKDAESDAISNFSSQRVTPDMLSESTKQFINASGGGTINNLADDEDLVSVDKGENLSVLKFADRAYNPDRFSGKGYKILRRNIVGGKNILTQEMINQPDTIYEIRYDFDLDGAQITIPENCILKFDGGSLSNGKLTSIGYVRCINSDTPDYSNELKCDIDNNFVDKFPINPYSKLQQKNDTILTLNVGYWSKETPVEQPTQFIDYIKSCGCIGITVVIALHNDEKGNIIRDYPENFYDYFHANGVNIEAVKFHIDGGDYNGRDNVEFYRNYVNEVRDITRDFVGKNDVHAIFILNEWYEPTDEGNKDMCNITRSLISDIKAWGFKVGISGYRGDKSNMPFDLFNKFDYKGLNIYPFFGLKDEFTTEENTDIYTPFNLLYNTMSSHGKYVANSITESGASESYYTLRNPADNTVKYGKNFTEYSPLIHLYNKGLFHFAGNLNPKFICTWYSKQLHLGKVEDLIKQYLF